MKIKELLGMGVFSTVVMDIGEEITRAVLPIKESMEPQYLGRWVLNMSDGVFIHDNIQTASQFRFEVPAAIAFHYFTGILLVGIFLWLRENIEAIPRSIYMGLAWAWLTLFLPLLIMFPAMGFGFFGPGANNDLNNMVASILAHTFYGCGMMLWLGWVSRFVMKDRNADRREGPAAEGSKA